MEAQAMRMCLSAHILCNEDFKIESAFLIIDYGPLLHRCRIAMHRTINFDTPSKYTCVSFCAGSCIYLEMRLNNIVSFVVSCDWLFCALIGQICCTCVTVMLRICQEESCRDLPAQSSAFRELICESFSICTCAMMKPCSFQCYFSVIFI